MSEEFKIAEAGVLGRIYEMRKALDIFEAWVLYGKMEKAGEGKSAIISEETCYMSHDSIKPIITKELK